LESGKRVVVEMGRRERKGAEGDRTWLGGEKGRRGEGWGLGGRG